MKTYRLLNNVSAPTDSDPVTVDCPSGRFVPPDAGRYQVQIVSGTPTYNFEVQAQLSPELSWVTIFEEKSATSNKVGVFDLYPRIRIAITSISGGNVSAAIAF